jgi:VanZ family protein
VSAPIRKGIRVITGIYTALLLTTSLLPSGSGPLGGWDASVTPDVQDALHLPAYAGLVVLWALAWSTRRALSAGTVAAIAIVCMAFGATMELAQSQIPGRTCSLKDGLVNAAGVLLGLAVILAGRRLHARRDSAKAAHPPACESVECRIQ